MKRILVVLLALGIVGVPIVGMAQEAPSPGPYDRSELLRTGQRGGGDVGQPAVRSIGEPPRGFVSIRYKDPTLIDALMGSEGSWKQLETGTVLRQNEIQVMGSAFGNASGKYTLVTVFWQNKQVETGNGTVTVAANQTVQRNTITFSEDELYSTVNVSYPPHTQETWQVTMWLERDGKKLEGVQWRALHRSNPATAAISIDSAAEAWGFTIRTAAVPGIISLIVGLIGARMTLRITGRGPGYGVGAWLFVVSFVGLMVSIVAYYQIAVILYNLPYVIGLSIGVIAYAAGLTFHEPVQKVGFLRRELSDSIRMPGRADVGELADAMENEDWGAELFDEMTEALFIDLPEVPAVRTDDGYKVPVKGVRPFFARLFADAATLDVTGIATRQKVDSGRIDDIITVDPDSEEAITHKPARMVRTLPWDTLQKRYEDTDEEPTSVESLMAAFYTAIIVVVPPAVGWYTFGQAVNIPGVGAVLGLCVTAVLSYSAEDGWIEFEAAPPHYQRVEDTLTLLQRAHKEAKEEMNAKQQVYEERSRTATEAREELTEEQRTVTGRMLEALGVEESKPLESADDEFEWEGDDAE